MTCLEAAQDKSRRVVQDTGLMLMATVCYRVVCLAEGKLPDIVPIVAALSRPCDGYIYMAEQHA